VKFTEKGEVKVDVTCLDDAEGARLCCSVSDTGIGIPEQKLATIFEPFSQGDSSTTRKYGGTGLGLAISRGLVEGMGGRIWVESLEQKGATFSFSIPLKGARNPEPHPVFDLEKLQGVRALVVD